MKKYGFIIVFLCLLILCGCRSDKVVISFNPNGGAFVESQSIKYGEKISDCVTSKEGYIFQGWYYDADLTLPYNGEELYENTTLYAKWKPVDYVIKFANEIHLPLTSPYLSEVDIPDAPTLEGYDFEGWYLDATFQKPFNDYIMPLNGATLYPKYVPKTYQVRFYNNSTLIDIQNVKYNESAIAPQVPIYPGHEFIGWDQSFDKVTTNLIVNAVYQNKKYQVTFETNGGEEISEVIVEYGESISPLTPKKPMQIFDGWYLDQDFKTPYNNTPITENTILYAKWQDAFSYILKYDNTYEIHKYLGNDMNLILPSEYRGQPITSISTNAFANNTSLKTVVISDTITHIRRFAFYDCMNLEEIIIPNAQIIEEGSLASCYNLQKITISFTGKSNNALGIESHFAYIFGKDEFANSYFVPLPLNVDNIKGYYLPKSLKEVTINNVTEIKEGSFRNCTNIEKVNLPNSLTKINNNGFYRCSNLQTINIPDSLNNIGDYAFYDCTSLKTVNLHNVSIIGNYTFKGCIDLTDVGLTLDSKLTQIGIGAFLGCSNLERVILPDSLEELSVALFAFCIQLKEVRIPIKVKEISEYCFYNCIELRTFIMRNQMEIISAYAFSNCHNLENVFLDKELKTIGQYAFSNCYKLQRILYAGSREEWLLINKGNNNYLNDIEINYDYLPNF